MCVIIYKKANQQLPSQDILELCWESNPHGAGVMWINKKRNVIEYAKGFMELEHLLSFLNKNKIMLEDTYTAIHFRYVSKGLKVPEQTQPFPVGSYNEKIENGIIFGTTEIALVHNGTMHSFGSALESDTKEFSEWCSTLISKGVPLDTLFDDIVPVVLGTGRMIFMTPKRIILYGTFHEKDNYKFSNLHWEYKKYLKPLKLPSSFKVF